MEVVHHPVNGFGCRISQGQGDGHLSEFEAGAVWRGESENADPLSALRRRKHWLSDNVGTGYRASAPERDLPVGCCRPARSAVVFDGHLTLPALGVAASHKVPVSNRLPDIDVPPCGWPAG
jgi:hypothetical protein